jgi:hypothetical protein
MSNKQGIFNVMSLPLNEDFMATGLAVRDLLKEGWKFDGFTQGDKNVIHVQLSREWEYEPMDKGCVEIRPENKDKPNVNLDFPGDVKYC